MLSLLKIKGMLDQLSASERKLADFILDNSNLLRDYSSQQLADAVGISQSSVVKFCQKLGYKGYPDLKLAITEAVVTATTLQREAPENNAELSGLAQLAEQLQQSLWQGLRGLLTINPESRLQQAAKLLQQARQILLAGSAHSAVVAADMQSRLLELGKLALFHSDPAVSLQLARTLPEGSIVLLISDSGENADLLRLEKYAKRRQLQIISLTRFQTSAQSAVADVTLFTLDTETDEHLARLVTQQAQQHLCHLLYLLLCQSPSYRQHITEHNKLLALLEKS
ncbi:MAG: MurR/RpiR family transcriptional regulator [Alishewanella aestuarii]|uniref:RpiR family transcriptional regulator n=2 Tax=Alishewanella aestuarii TaxID=453835 RepID=J1Q6S7_9ALTE|nr:MULTISPECIES: MurR/RpiR family transcriptional regulator [Alishewanella]EJI86878.1 RpiR family transcriptional regulator [Alishewanella aestuarii B11]MCT8127295.1 MurR/RpiR family transcriptional regulator [Alishewanella sp. BS5-314]